MTSTFEVGQVVLLSAEDQRGDNPQYDALRGHSKYPQTFDYIGKKIFILLMNHRSYAAVIGRAVTFTSWGRYELR